MPTEQQELKAFSISTPVEWIEASAGDGQPKLRRFSMVAYTGGAMDIEGYSLPLVIDIEGVDIPSQTLPALYGHAATQIVGHTDSIVSTQQRIKASGLVSGQGPHVDEIIANADRGFPWQVSLSVRPNKVERVPAGDAAKANGRVFSGPILIARKSRLKEISFVSLGADDQTSAAIAAVRSGGSSMNEFEKWLQAKSLDPSTLSAEVKTVLEASFKAEVKAKDDADALIKAEADRRAKEAEKPPVDIIAKQNEAAAANLERITKLQELGVGHPKIVAQAIKENWDETKTELAVLRASRANVVAIHSHGGPSMEPTVIEAAMCKALRLPNIEKEYKPEVLEAADRDYKRISLHQLFITAAVANGYHARAGESIHDGNLRSILAYACPGQMIKADGFSTLSLPNILENVANKQLLAGYMEEDQTWREIATVRSVNDFKQSKFYRLLDSMEYEQLGPTGEIKHGTISEETYTSQIHTYARMFALPREVIINDDLGALDDLRTRIGRGQAMKFNRVFWTAFLNNSSFFTAGLTNYISGSTTNLGTDGVGMGLGVAGFRKMTSPSTDGTKRVGVGMTPTKLLVPPELETNARLLWASTNLAQVKTSDGNIFANRYRPIIQNRLSESAFTGYSTTAWYLFGDTMNPMVVSFLNGQESPTVESAQADFDTLGMQFRGYHDFGADKSEYLAGIKSKGAA